MIIFLYITVTCMFLNLLIALPQHYLVYMNGDEDTRKIYENFSFIDWFVFEKDTSFSKDSDWSFKVEVFLILVTTFSFVLTAYNIITFIKNNIHFKCTTNFKLKLPSFSMTTFFKYMHKRKYPENYI